MGFFLFSSSITPRFEADNGLSINITFLLASRIVIEWVTSPRVKLGNLTNSPKKNLNAAVRNHL